MVADPGETQRYFTELYDTTYREMLRYVVTRCRNVGDIPDLLQNIYLNFYRRLLRFGPDHFTEPRGYLFRIARDELFRHYRRAGRESASAAAPPGEEEGAGETDASFLTEETAEDHLLCDEIWEDLKSRDLLTFRIFYLYFVSGSKLEEIAAELKVGPSTVKNRLYRTLHEIRSKFAL